MFSAGQRPLRGLPWPSSSAVRPLPCTRQHLSLFCNLHVTRSPPPRQWNPLRVPHQHRGFEDCAGHGNTWGRSRRRVLRLASRDNTGTSASPVEEGPEARGCGQQQNSCFNHAWWRRWVEGAALGAALIGLAAVGPKHARAQPTHDMQPDQGRLLRVSEAGTSGRQTGRARDTGIQLAAAAVDEEAEVEQAIDDEFQQALDAHVGVMEKRRFQSYTKKGKKVDPLKSNVADPKGWDYGKLPQTAWRFDLMKNMTYTQFWHLVRERKIDKVKYTTNKQSLWVTTKDSAPGGRRTEKVGLPYDPELFDHMVLHGVVVEHTPFNHFNSLLMNCIRLMFPMWFAYVLIIFAFRIGVKKKRDRIFGGAKLEQINKMSKTTFDDIAGIDQVKAEINEIVQFLRNPRRFLNLGARSPAGILLVGPPGTGKTLLAKAIAGEANVPFYSAAGTEFMEVFVGVGASRVRDMFAKARKAAPCILFIDEFDGIGQQRSYSSMGNDESVQTINQLLTEMDGFEDNTGVIVMAATNRPASLDSALTRPGRFDRIIHLPLPDLDGRVAILKVHARDKKVSKDVNYSRVARASAGFTGAQLMNLMNVAAIVTVRRGAAEILESDIFQALENIQSEKAGGPTSAALTDEDRVPPVIRRQVAVYEASRALIGYITPYFDEISKVSVCPGGATTGFTYFIPQEEHLETRVVTRQYMEAKMTVGMAGRCGERLMLGDANISAAGAPDLDLVNSIAREMVYRCGFSRRMGPVSLMDTSDYYLKSSGTRAVASIGTELATVALRDVEDFITGAEAKAYYGLATNYDCLKVLITALLEKETLSGEQLANLLEENGVKKFPDPFVEGFRWDENGHLVWPGMSDYSAPAPDLDNDEALFGVGASSTNGAGNSPEGDNGNGRASEDGEDGDDGESTNGNGSEDDADVGDDLLNSQWPLPAPLNRMHPLNPYRTRLDLPDMMRDFGRP